MDFHKDEELIKRLQSGDNEAFNELYEKYYKPLLYTACRLTNNIEDAKDAVQSAFMQMYTSIHNLKEPKYFRLWMNKIVRGKCIDMFHKNKDVIVDTSQDEIINQYEEQNTDFIPHDKLKFTADQDILMNLIDELPDRYQEILFYAYFYQFSMKEMAELLNIPTGTVKSRLYAAKKALREKVSEYETLNRYKLTFRIPGAMSIYLFFLFHRQVKPIKLKKSFQFMKQKAMLLSLTVAGVSVLAVPLLTGNYQETAGDAYHNLNTAQEAYFKLKHWAMDEVQMSEKSTADIDEIEAVYDFLKSQKGPYWERIQNDGWDRAFEKLKK